MPLAKRSLHSFKAIVKYTFRSIGCFQLLFNIYTYGKFNVNYRVEMKLIFWYLKSHIFGFSNKTILRTLYMFEGHEMEKQIYAILDLIKMFHLQFKANCFYYVTSCTF